MAQTLKAAPIKSRHGQTAAGGFAKYAIIAFTLSDPVWVPLNHREWQILFSLRLRK
jgi:hypothetical protein